MVENCIQVPQLPDDRMGMTGKDPGHPMGCCSRSFSMLVNSTSSEGSLGQHHPSAQHTSQTLVYFKQKGNALGRVTEI